MTSERPFANTAATDVVNKLENAITHKTKDPVKELPKASSVYLKNQKLSMIKEDDKENITEMKSKEVETPEIGLPGIEKKELYNVKEMNESHGEDSKSQIQLQQEDEKPKEEVKGEEGMESFDNILLMQLSAYYTFFLNSDNYHEKGAAGENVLQPELIMKGLRTMVIFQSEPLYEKLIDMIKKSFDLADAMKKGKDKETSMYSSGVRTETDMKRNRGADKDYKDMLGQIDAAIKKIKKRIAKYLSMLIIGRPERTKVTEASGEKVMKIAENLSSEYNKVILPFIRYMNYVNENSNDMYETDMIRYLSFAYTRTELEQIFMKCFYEQFDEKLNYGLNMKEFAACLNFVAKKLNNKSFMRDIFSFMGVQADTTAGSLLNAENVKGAEFDVNIYRKAFLHLREFDHTDETKDIVTFKQLLPYLYCFFIAFETIAIKRRKSLYRQFKVWIVSAFREAAGEYRAGQTPKISDETVLKTLMDKGSNSYTYDEVIEALTILQSRHHDNFGHAEFQVITESLQRVFDVDPVTFKSKKTAPLTSKKLFLFPLAVWETDASHKNFNLLQYLAMKLAQLSMFQGLANERKGDNLFFIREERLLLYNEAEVFTGKSRLSKYFGRLASFDAGEDAVSTGIFIIKLVDNIKVLYPGFDFLDGVLTVLHYFSLKDPTKHELPDILAPDDQEAIYDNLSSLLNSVMYERLFHFYLSKIGRINFETIYNSKGENLTMQNLQQFGTDTEIEDDYDTKGQEDTEVEIPKIVQPTPEVRVDVPKPKSNESTLIKQKKKVQIPREPTVYEGLELKPKKDKVVTEKYIDMKDLEFSIAKRNVPRKETKSVDTKEADKGCKLL
eukprot:TRINITY_DN4085_c0_g5_i1.p1 TRINITY_DN4085_c0_g5~~TRINITY_DN4085_c0_g5_i1.p1  ORF type:complete len:841 (+),score=311.32 TRINITY_DN4085_c0_g5_i1:152-2674(+)